jgi:hypothetical protein
MAPEPCVAADTLLPVKWVLPLLSRPTKLSKLKRRRRIAGPAPASAAAVAEAEMAMARAAVVWSA